MNLSCYYDNSTIGIPVYNDLRLSCPPGFYCPNIRTNNTQTSPRICPASQECILDRLKGYPCTPQGPLEPLLCKPGHYCPTFLQQIQCPRGNYCPPGSIAPFRCDAISICPPGTSFQRSLTGVILCIIIDCLLMLFWLVREKVVSKTLRNKLETKDLEKSDIKNEASILPLVSAFRQGLDGQQISMDFKFTDMGLKLANEKHILQGVTGYIKSSRMTAIMGPSGAGKTTFMNVLCGKVARTSGQLLINGVESEIHDYKKLIGYVPQEDIMLRELTVRQVLTHSARVRLPKSWSNSQIDEYVESLMRALSLSHVADSKIGDEVTRGISGGQRKRVNIGIELAAVPVCMFLDEPTSGLDSTSALEVAKILQNITSLGLTIVAVIHQPRIEIFQAFDDVLMIVPGGRTAYIGPVNQAQSYFEKLGYIFPPSSNAADVLMDILSGKGINKRQNYTIEQLAHIWQRRSFEQEPVKTKSNPRFHQVATSLSQDRGACLLSQIHHCCQRSVVQQFNSPSGFILEILVGAIAGAVMGISVYSANALYRGVLNPPFSSLSAATIEWLIPQYGFLLSAGAALAAAPAGVKVFSEERAVYWREASSGHSPIAYYIGKTFSVIGRIAICSLHFAAMMHTNSQPLVSFQDLYLMVFLLFFGVYGLSATISMLVARQNAALLSVVVCLFFSVFSGFGFTLKDAAKNNVEWLFDLSFNRWTGEAIYTTSILPFKNVYMVDASSEFWGYTLGRKDYDFAMAFVTGLYWRFIAYGLMVMLNRSKQV